MAFTITDLEARRGKAARQPDTVTPTRQPMSADDILHLAELVPVLRQRLELDSAFPDDAILASLRSIAAETAPRERWRAAFDSNLGAWLALKGRDLNTTLNTLIALLPKPRM